MEGVDAGRDERGQDRLQLLRGPGEARVVGLLLPLRVAEDHRELGRDGRTDRGHDLGRELRTGHGVAAVGVGTAVRPLPQELVDEVAVGAVELDSVEADALGGRGGLGEGADDVVQVAPGHRPARALGAVDADAGGAHGGGVGVGRLPLPAHHADVPQLRDDRAARRVHGLGDLRPPRQLFLAVEARHAIALPGRLVADVGPLRDDQAHAGGGTAGVVRPHVLAGNTAGREHAGHRRHHDAVRDGEAVQCDRPGQDLGRTGSGGRGDGHGDAPHGYCLTTLLLEDFKQQEEGRHQYLRWSSFPG